MTYPDFGADRPFAMPESYRRKIAGFSHEQLVDALCREAELRGQWEYVATQHGLGWSYDRHRIVTK